MNSNVPEYMPIYRIVKGNFKGQQLFWAILYDERGQKRGQTKAFETRDEVDDAAIALDKQLQHCEMLKMLLRSIGCE